MSTLNLGTLEPNSFLSQSELAALLAKSEAWAERARWLGVGPPYHKIGRRVFYKGADIITWIASSRVEPTI